MCGRDVPPCTTLKSQSLKIILRVKKKKQRNYIAMNTMTDDLIPKLVTIIIMATKNNDYGR